MSTAVSIVRTLLGLLFDHTIGNIVRMIPIIRLPKLERGPVSRGFSRPAAGHFVLRADDAVLGQLFQRLRHQR